MWRFPGAMHAAPIEGVLKLKQEGDKLTGSLSREGAERPIEQGKVVGDEIVFQVVWYRAGQPNPTQYKGKINGDTIKGTIISSWSGQTRTIDWNAKRAK